MAKGELQREERNFSRRRGPTWTDLAPCRRGSGMQVPDWKRRSWENFKMEAWMERSRKEEVFRREITNFIKLSWLKNP